MWMSTSKQVLHPPINGTSDEHFRLKSFSDPRLPDDKGAGLDKRDPQVKCEQRGGMGSRMAHETADYSRVVVQPSQEKIASRPKSSQHSGWTVFEAAFMARCSGARMGGSATGCLCHRHAICPADASTCRDRETSEPRVIPPLELPCVRADSFEQCLRGLNPDQSPASTIAGPVAKAAGPLVFRERRRETSAAFSRFGPRSEGIARATNRGPRLCREACSYPAPARSRGTGATLAQSLSTSLVPGCPG